MTEETATTSRLPAGSTLEVAPGLHVPHPHAQANLAGKPDPRVGDTDAVTETLDGEQRPLDESVRPKTITTKDTGTAEKVLTVVPADGEKPAESVVTE